MIESDLQFQFDATWLIKKYDNNRYYKIISGKGLSAVDFVGLWKEEVVFIEVKNYRNRPIQEFGRTRSKVEGMPPPLVAIFKEKVEESIQGISVIRTYLRRKWVYSLLDNALSYSIGRWLVLRSEQLFWMYIDQKIKATPKAVRLVLWLELPDELEGARSNLRDCLKKTLADDFSLVEIACQEAHPFGESLKIGFR